MLRQGVLRAGRSLGLLAAMLALSCRSAEDRAPARAASPAVAQEARFAEARRKLVAHLQEEQITSPRVLAALARVPRHALVPSDMQPHAYEDRPLPIGQGQTISQPYIVALMTELADVQPGDRVLEVGTGSGYQAAVLAELTNHVYTIEILAPLAERAREDLVRLGYGDRIQFRVGDGYAGWPDAAPFDAIVVTAAPPKIPEALKAQLTMGGRLVIPVGDAEQELIVIERTAEGLVQRSVVPVLFVPMTGRAQQ